MAAVLWFYNGGCPFLGFEFKFDRRPFSGRKSTFDKASVPVYVGQLSLFVLDFDFMSQVTCHTNELPPSWNRGHGLWFGYIVKIYF
jgi:hypothetical protein